MQLDSVTANKKIKQRFILAMTNTYYHSAFLY